MNIATAALLATMQYPEAGNNEVTFGIVDGQEHFAVVYYHNQITSALPAEEIIFISTPYGEVAFRLTRRGNYSDQPGDTSGLWESPPNVVVDPWILDLDERERGEMRLFLWEGM